MLVQKAPAVVSSSAPAPGLSAPVDVEAELVGLIASHGDDGVVGADQVAHGAADTCIGRIGLLPDAVINLEHIGGLFGQIQLPFTSRLRKTPSSMAFTGQTAVHCPQRVHLSLCHRICQGRSFTLSVEGVMGPFGNIC